MWKDVFARPALPQPQVELIGGRFAILELVRRSSSETVLNGVDYDNAMAPVQICLLASKEFSRLPDHRAGSLAEQVFGTFSRTVLPGAIKPIYWGRYHDEVIVVYPAPLGTCLRELHCSDRYSELLPALTEHLENILAHAASMDIDVAGIAAENVFVMLHGSAVYDVSVHGFGHSRICELAAAAWNAPEPQITAPSSPAKPVTLLEQQAWRPSGDQVGDQIGRTTPVAPPLAPVAAILQAAQCFTTRAVQLVSTAKRVRIADSGVLTRTVAAWQVASRHSRIAVGGGKDLAAQAILGTKELRDLSPIWRLRLVFATLLGAIFACACCLAAIA